MNNNMLTPMELKLAAEIHCPQLIREVKKINSKEKRAQFWENLANNGKFKTGYDFVQYMEENWGLEEA